MSERSAPFQQFIPLIRLDQRKSLLVRLIVAALLVGATLLGSFVIGATGQGTPIVLGAIAIVAALLMFAQPELGAYILIAFVFLNLSDVAKAAFGVPSLIRPLVIFMMVSVLANRVFIQKKPIIFHGLEVSILVTGIIMFITSFGAVDQALASEQMGEWIKNFAILIILVQLCSQERVFKHAQWVIILSAAFLALLSTYQVLSGNYTNDFYGLAKAPIHQITRGNDSNRLTGPLDDPNFYAQILLSVMPLAAYRALTAFSRRRRIIAMICLASILFAVIFTYSRAGFIALAIVTALIIRDLKINPYKVLAGIVVVVVLALPFLPPNYLNRLMTLEDAVSGSGGISNEQSFNGRYSELLSAIQMFLDHPLLGVGIGNFSAHYQDYSTRLGIDSRSEAREAHNFYTELAAERGFIGLASFFVMFLMIFGSLKRAKRQVVEAERPDLLPWISAVQFGFISYLLTSIFLHDSYSRYFWLMIAIVASAAAMSEAILQRYKQKVAEASHEFLFTRF